MRQMSLLKRKMSYGEGAQGRVKAVSSKQLFSILIGLDTLHVHEHNHISIVDISKFFLILEIHPRFYSQLRSWTPETRCYHYCQTRTNSHAYCAQLPATSSESSYRKRLKVYSMKGIDGKYISFLGM